MTPTDLLANLPDTVPHDERGGLIRLARRITVDPDTGCWVCNYTPRSKYVKTHIGGRAEHGGWQVLGHRLFYAASRGESVKALDARGLCLDHVRARGCLGGHCVNPAHLEEVTIRENTLRGDGYTAQRARRTHCPRGHLLAGANLRPDSLRKGYRSCLVCKRAQVRLRRRPPQHRTDEAFAELVADELIRSDGGRRVVAGDALGLT